MEKKKRDILKTAKQGKEEFAGFLAKYGVIQLAVGVVIGSAVKDLVSSIANNLIMPIVGLITPNGSWQSWVMEIGEAKFGVGEVVSSLLDFLIVAMVVFVVLKKVLKIDLKK